MTLARAYWALLAALTIALAAGLAFGSTSIEDPGPQTTLLLRSEALVHGVGRAEHIWSVSVLVGVLTLLVVSLLFARRGRAVAAGGRPLRGPASRIVALAFGLAGVGACAKFFSGVGLHRLADIRPIPLVVTAAAAVLITAYAAGAKQPASLEAAAPVPRDAFGAAWLGLLAVLLCSAWVPLARAASLRTFGDDLVQAPLHQWLAATGGLPSGSRPGDGSPGSALFLLPVVLVLALLAPLRAAAPGFIVTLGYCAVTLGGFVTFRVAGERALVTLDGLSSRFGGTFAGTRIPSSLGGLDACGPLVAADVLTFGASRASIGGIDVGRLRVTDAECEDLAWKLVQRAHSHIDRASPLAAAPVAWIRADRGVPFAPLGCLVSALVRVAARQRAASSPIPLRVDERSSFDPSGQAVGGESRYLGSRFAAPRMVWVGQDDGGGLRCAAQPLVDPAEPPCKQCDSDKRVEITSEEVKFTLLWRIGGTVINSVDVRRDAAGGGACPYPALSDRLFSEWRAMGQHPAPSDRVRDVAVVRTRSMTSLSEAMDVAGCAASIDLPGSSSGDAPPLRAFDVMILPDR